MATSSVEVGKKAPGFQLRNQDDELVSLDDLAGKWVVLYFYPKDDTPGCTTEACEFTSEINSFEGLDAVVIGVSPDSPASHREFIARHKLKLTLLSDPEHQVMERCGAWGRKQMSGKEAVGVIRGTALLDPEGNVAYHWPEVKAEGHAEAVRKRLEELRGIA
jgi:peroxiredoxin Q/BCP